MDHGRTVTVLLVEDNDVDSEALVRAFKRKKLANPLVIARDGQEALDLLRGAHGKIPLERPYLILLDLNMPRMDGLEFLGHLRQDAELAKSIVFVLTTSNADSDKVAAYGHNVAGYIVKVNVADEFLNIVTMVESFWRIIEFPP